MSRLMSVAFTEAAVVDRLLDERLTLIASVKR